MAVSFAKQSNAKIHFLYVIEPVSANTASLVNSRFCTGVKTTGYSPVVKILKSIT